MLNSQIGSNSNKLILFGIILIACALRFHDFLNLPFFHDEYSAILRTDYDNLSDLVEHGVKPDFHPAGVQFFLYFWVKFFGTDPWIVKLPFALASIASIYLGYAVAKKWTNETVGLITAAFLATSQFSIIYGTYARPYSFGLFFTLLLILALTNMIRHPERQFRRNWILFVVAGAACAYNQYVNMLVAGIIGITALPLIPRKFLLHYLSAGLAIGLLYLPHLPIFFYHMNKGGIGGSEGWLGAPDFTFITGYFSYLFHHSIWSFVLIIFILLTGWLLGRKINYTPPFPASKRIYLIVAWFFLPFLICYYYSVYKNPIIQYSVLIFTHFLIYLLLFGHIKPLKTTGNSIIVSAIIFTNVCTLIYTREHFHVHYKVGYEQILPTLENERKKHPDLPALVSSDFRFTDYLQKKQHRTVPFDKNTFETYSELLHYLDSISQKSEYFYYVETDYDQPKVPMIRHYFPKIEWQLNNQVNAIYLFSKHGTTHDSGSIFHWNTTDRLSQEWQHVQPEQFISKNGKWAYHMDSLSEWGPKITFDLKDIVATTNNVIDIEISTENLNPEKEVVIVAIIKDRDSTILWTGNSSLHQSVNGNCHTIYHSLSIPKMKYIYNYQLEVMIWNLDKSTFNITGIDIRLRDGNPYRFTQFDPIRPAVISELKGLQPLQTALP